MTDWDEFTGHFESVDAVDIRPRVSGFVQRVAFTEGAIVRRGDPLFYIDARPYEADVSRAEAELARARTRAELASGEHVRAQRLVATQAISREELDSRSSSQEEGNAAVKSAEAALATAQAQSRVDGRPRADLRSRRSRRRSRRATSCRPVRRRRRC